jgi:hypothetical protein
MAVALVVAHDIFTTTGCMRKGRSCRVTTKLNAKFELLINKYKQPDNLMCIKSCAAPRSSGFFAILAFRGQFITPTTDFMHD